jgi:hypothetical protein
MRERERERERIKCAEYTQNNLYNNPNTKTQNYMCSGEIKTHNIGWSLARTVTKIHMKSNKY